MNKFYLLISFIALWSCRGNESDPDTILFPETNEEFSGGSTTVFVEGFNAFELKAPGMSFENRSLFALGNSLFEQNWVTAPSSTTARDGLGPFYNAKSCAACHFKDGRGRAPESFGQVETGFLIQLSIAGTDQLGRPLHHPVYGGQFQDQAIMGQTKEGTVQITYATIQGSYDDGTTYTLKKPLYNFTNLGYGTLDNVFYSPRIAPQMIGLGLLEAIPVSDILAYEDVNDIDGDGISGKAIYVWDLEAQDYVLGRFGWKSSAPSIKQQVAIAFSFDMGLTTELFRMDRCPEGVDCSSIPNGGNPEVPNERLKQVTVYSTTLAVPARRDFSEQNVLRGKKLFNEMDCVKCHISTHTTGSYTIPQIANQVIGPYTDMLLHDMGEGLSDHRAVQGASGNEWRTPPLWGIGYFEEVMTYKAFLHDGKANTIEEAILWHGGEAENAKNQFKALKASERNDVLDFLNSL